MRVRRSTPVIGAVSPSGAPRSEQGHETTNAPSHVARPARPPLPCQLPRKLLLIVDAATLDHYTRKAMTLPLGPDRSALVNGCSALGCRRPGTARRFLWLATDLSSPRGRRQDLRLVGAAASTSTRVQHPRAWMLHLVGDAAGTSTHVQHPRRRCCTRRDMPRASWPRCNLRGHGGCTQRDMLRASWPGCNMRDRRRYTWRDMRQTSRSRRSGGTSARRSAMFTNETRFVVPIKTRPDT